MKFTVMYETEDKYKGFKPMPSSRFSAEIQKRIIEEITGNLQEKREEPIVVVYEECINSQLMPLGPCEGAVNQQTGLCDECNESLLDSKGGLI